MTIDYSKWPTLVEACMEWIAQRWTKSMIRAELRDWFKDDIDWRTCQCIIKAAKEEIKRKYNIDASEYRGTQISFYEMIIREKKYYAENIKVESRIKAAERLDKLFNLEGIQAEDADTIAEHVRAALQEMDESQFSEVPDDARSELEGLRKTYNDAQRERSAKPANGATTSGEQPTSNSPPTDEPPTEGAAESTEETVGPIPKRSETIERPDADDCEDVASINDLPPQLRDLITNPENDEKFKQFEKRKKRRKELDGDE